MTDEHTRKLIKLYRKTKSRTALEVLLRNHQAAIYKVSSELPHNFIDMDEKLQLGRILIQEAIHKFDLRRKTKFNTYLMTFLKHRLLDEIRKRVRRSAGELHDNIGQDPDTTFEDEEIKELLHQKIAELPYNERIVILLEMEGMKLVEIAKQAGVTVSRISQLRTKALFTLKKKMRAKNNEI